MNMMLGENLRRLRSDRRLTQEKLSSELGVSPQAVSRWETGAALPDICMLPVIADFFDVSIDELLGRGTNCPPPEREAAFRKMAELDSCDLKDEAIALNREMSKRFPGDDYFLHSLANRLFNTGNSTYNEEIFEICERIERLSKNADMIVGAERILVKMYLRTNQREQAHRLANKLPSLFCGRELHIRDTVDGRARLDCCLNNAKIFSRLLCGELKRIDDLYSRAELRELYLRTAGEIEALITQITEFIDKTDKLNI